jgi:hypothetical protein
MRTPLQEQSAQVNVVPATLPAHVLPPLQLNASSYRER